MNRPAQFLFPRDIKRYCPYVPLVARIALYGMDACSYRANDPGSWNAREPSRLSECLWAGMAHQFRRIP